VVVPFLPSIDAQQMKQRYRSAPSSTQSALNDIPSDKGLLSKQITIRKAEWKVRFTELVAEINTSCTVDSPFVLKYITAPALRRVDSEDLQVNLEMPRLDAVLAHHWSNMPSSSSASVSELCRYWKQLLLGLRSMHRVAGILHGDIKDANVMVDLSTRTAKLIDFGLSRVCNGDHSIRFCKAYPHGTRSFRAPELWEEKSYGFPSDVYSLGGVFLQMLTGSLQAKLFDFPPRSSSDANSSRAEYAALRQKMEAELFVFNEEDGDVYSAVVVRNWLETKFPGDALFAGCSQARPHERFQLLAIVASMLALDPSERATPEQLLASPLFTDASAGMVVEEQNASSSTDLPAPLPDATSSSLRWIWNFAMQHALPLNSTLLAAHLVVQTLRAHQKVADDGGLSAVASLLLAARLFGHAPELLQTIYDAARPATPATLQQQEWTILCQLNGALVKNFDETAMRRVLFAL
jgi:serine/threonine protein kinase